MARDSVAEYINEFIVETPSEEFRVPVEMDTTVESTLVPRRTWDYKVRYLEAY